MKLPAPEKMDEYCEKAKQEAMQCELEEPCVKEKDDCCTTDSTCVCFFCFQLLAPAEGLTKFRFHLAEEKHLNGYYRQAGWNNPFIDGPLQPPDRV